MHLQKAKSSNLAGNNFSVRLRCDVLAQRSTNSRKASQSAGLSADATISAAGARLQRHTGAQAQATRKKCRDWRGELRSLGGVGRQFATLQHGDCTVCFVCLLLSYFRAEKLYESASDLKLLFCDFPNFLTKNKVTTPRTQITREIKMRHMKNKNAEATIHVPDFSAANDS